MTQQKEILNDVLSTNIQTLGELRKAVAAREIDVEPHFYSPDSDEYKLIVISAILEGNDDEDDDYNLTGKNDHILGIIGNQNNKFKPALYYAQSTSNQPVEEGVYISRLEDAFNITSWWDSEWNIHSGFTFEEQQRIDNATAIVESSAVHGDTTATLYQDEKGQFLITECVSATKPFSVTFRVISNDEFNEISPAIADMTENAEVIQYLLRYEREKALE
ncbi:hypothetical protein [Zooshikella sp. RANM57]|uniref:hypothetical protein n=1 Tax=Zooshikella sp. RANM57 TaxID=3425863 RepID=UPI003D6ED992